MKKCLHLKDCQDKTLSQGDATLIFHEYLYAFQIFCAIDDKAVILSTPDKVLLRYAHLYMRKNCPINNHVIDVVSQLFESGIAHKLYLDAIAVHVVAKAKLFAKSAVRPMRNGCSCKSGCSLNLYDIAPVFYLWLVGCAFSSLVFL